MATLTTINPKLIESSPAKPMSTREVYAHTSATWKAGQFGKIVAGLLKTSTSGAAVGVGADAIQVYFLKTLDSATGDNTTIKRVGVVHEDDLWEMNTNSSSTSALTVIGVQYALAVASNVCTVNVSDTTNVVFRVESANWNERPYQDLSADTYARIPVKVLSTAIYTVGA